MFSSSNSHWPGLNCGCHGLWHILQAFSLTWDVGYFGGIPYHCHHLRWDKSNCPHQASDATPHDKNTDRSNFRTKNMPNTARLWLAVDLFGELGFHGCSPPKSEIPQDKSSISGWWFQPLLKKYESQLGLWFPIYGKKMFQTTNQILMGFSITIQLWGYPQDYGNPWEIPIFPVNSPGFCR